MTSQIDAVFIASEIDDLRASAMEKSKTSAWHGALYHSKLVALLDALTVPRRNPDVPSGHCCRKEQWNVIKMRIALAALLNCYEVEDVGVSEIQTLIDEAGLDTR